MPFHEDDIHANLQYFENKLRAVKQKADVVRRVQEGRGDFLLLDTRTREAFAQGHIQGAWSLPLAELKTLAGELPLDMELVTYCWNDT